MIQAINITKKFRKKIVLNNLNVQIPENRMIALTGPNAIGKTVLLECLANYRKADSGIFTLDEKPLGEIQLRENLVYQRRGLYCSPKSNVENAIESFSILFPSFSREKAHSLLGRWGIDVKKPWFELSLGQQQKGEISLFLSLEARIYLFDEPFSNLDTLSCKELKKCILEHIPENSSCVMSIHNLAGMEGFFTDLWVLKSAEELVAFDFIDTDQNEDLPTLYEEVIQ